MQLLLLVNILKTTMCILLFYVHNINLQMYFTNIQYSRLPALQLPNVSKRCLNIQEKVICKLFSNKYKIPILSVAKFT